MYVRKERLSKKFASRLSGWFISNKKAGKNKINSNNYRHQLNLIKVDIIDTITTLMKFVVCIFYLFMIHTTFIHCIYLQHINFAKSISLSNPMLFTLIFDFYCSSPCTKCILRVMHHAAQIIRVTQWVDVSCWFLWKLYLGFCNVRNSWHYIQLT